MEITKELLAMALTHSSEAILIKDRNGVVLLASQRVADFHKCSLNDILGRTAFDLMPIEIATRIKELDERAMETGKPETQEETWDLVHDQRILLVSRNPIRNTEGITVGLLTHYTNISHIKQAFHFFEQNQKRFAALAETCPVGIFECNPQHRLSYVNPEWQRITGLPLASVVGKHWMDFVAAEDTDVLKHLLGSADSQPSGDRVDCTIQGTHSVTVELSLNRVADTKNHTVSYIGSIVDLTYRLAAQKELREKANLLRDLTSSVPAIIWQLSLASECVFVNDYFETVTGMPIETVLGKSWERLIHPDDLSHVVASTNIVFIGAETSARHEFRMLGKGGKWRWMMTNCQRIHSTDGSFVGIAGHTIDITERKRAEEELQHNNLLLEERVHERTKELLTEIENRQIAEELLEQKRAQIAHFSRVSVMGRLSGELAHELNQPLNAIQNYVASLSKILATSPSSDATTNVLAKLSGEVTRAAKIIRRTREFVSTAKHQAELLSLTELVADTAAMLKGEARRKGMTIKIVVNSHSANALGDPVRLQQVLVNLVLNALEAMVDHPESNKTVTMEVDALPTRNQITVMDSGCGVNESLRDRLFDAFFTTKTSGLGMGLAISQGIVEEHGGTLRYEPREEGGSKFIIELPRAPSN